MFQHITRRDRIPGNQTSVKNFEAGKLEKELNWCEKANINIQIAV